MLFYFHRHLKIKMSKRKSDKDEFFDKDELSEQEDELLENEGSEQFSVNQKVYN